MNHIRRTILLLALASLPRLTAQTSKPPAFEVASIKPGDPSARGVRIQINPGGRFTAANVNLKFLIQYAYGVRDFQIAGAPGWAGSDRYEISAKPEEGENATQDQLKLMMQTLLADRFQLTFHRETKELPVYALVVGKNGSKLQQAEAANRPELRMGRGMMSAKGVSMEMLANQLAQQLGRSVIDRTGLKGQYDMKLEWTPDTSEPRDPMKGDVRATPDAAPAPDAAGPSIFTAIQEQLGLKLEGQKGPVDILVIDHVEKPSAN
jgi:bla regulator protein BlaR1